MKKSGLGSDRRDAAGNEVESIFSDRASIEKLVKRASKGEAAAQRLLVQQLRPRLVHQLRTLGWPDDAEDMAHDALIILFCRIQDRQLVDPSMVCAFSSGIAARLSLSKYRKIRRQKTVIDSDAVDAYSDDASSPEYCAMQQEARVAIERLIEQLTQPRDRTILKQLYLDGRERVQVRNDLAMTGPQFDRVLHRSKQRLSQLAARSNVSA